MKQNIFNQFFFLEKKKNHILFELMISMLWYNVRQVKLEIQKFLLSEQQKIQIKI